MRTRTFNVRSEDASASGPASLRSLRHCRRTRGSFETGVVSYGQLMSEPRRHHYLPRSYLSAFSSPDGGLTVLRVDGRLLLRVTPKTIAFERDLYRVDGIEGIEPNDFEKAFSGLEGAFVEVRRDIAMRDALPVRGTSEFETLMEFMSLTLVRGPLLRERVNARMLEFAREATDEMTATPEAFREAIESARDEGLDVPTDSQVLEQLRRMRFENSTVTVPNFVFMQVLFRGLDQVRQPLADRYWTLYRSFDADFITCDRPVSVTAEESGTKGRFAGVADLWSPESEVAFPLTRDLMMVGTSGHQGAAYAIRAEHRQVAALNSRTVGRAMEFYCWSGGRFVWLMPNGAVGGLEDMREALADLRR